MFVLVHYNVIKLVIPTIRCSPECLHVPSLPLSPCTQNQPSDSILTFKSSTTSHTRILKPAPDPQDRDLFVLGVGSFQNTLDIFFPP